MGYQHGASIPSLCSFFWLWGNSSSVRRRRRILRRKVFIDLEAYYQRVRRPYYVLLALMCLVGIAVNFDMMKVNHSLFVQENLLTLLVFPLCALALMVRANWAQWVSGAILLVLNFAFLILFESMLR